MFTQKFFSALFISFFVAAFASAETEDCARNPSDTLSSIKKEGEATALSILYDSPDWNCIMEKVSAADPAWLRAIGPLVSFSDGAVSEELDVSLSEALVVSPERVFESVSVLSNYSRLKGVCGALPIDEAVGAKARALRLLNVRRQALSLSAKNVQWKKRSELCLRYIDNAIAKVKKYAK